MVSGGGATATSCGSSSKHFERAIAPFRLAYNRAFAAPARAEATHDRERVNEAEPAWLLSAWVRPGSDHMTNAARS